MNDKIYVPPIKIQGKKTKLIPFIKDNLPHNFDVWIEPFMGSGSVGFNINHPKAIFADNNPHIINFYSDIKNGNIDAKIAREFLQFNGAKLESSGQDYYYSMRSDFNNNPSSLYFLFLNRSCFNGVVRFNRRMEFNTPYNHKPDRFSKAYITKIVNQIDIACNLIKNNDWQFICQDFKNTIQLAKNNDLIYCDPPYIGRNTNYFDVWDESKELQLNKHLIDSNAMFMVSTWHSGNSRSNEYLNSIWSKYTIKTINHTYQVAAKTENRSEIKEAIILNYINE